MILFPFILFPFYRGIFNCETLVDLKLKSCGVIPISGPVFLPRLKKLYLIDPRCEANESLPNLISGCPVLEEFTIVYVPDVLARNVFSPTVKRLSLNLVSDCRISNTLDINAPALEYLEINSSSPGQMKSGLLNSLTEADIWLNNYNRTKEDLFLYYRSLLEFIGRLCNIVDSVFSTWSWTTSFHNLTKLELSADYRFLVIKVPRAS
ncbi:PREDICTED: F-box/LRR-repeat protein At3g26922-like [Erythranthe guttata]|uniref:F-box/LRR-repeat protein At3g26922-like n=1 Tax=Erythranthe guttata TaxID=4155 RepID=UPI00064DEE94|nr:PREDICTED: F-box/LRR-repeat protein At3g26922-like [Erythranthe guttata]|eukprot:XP_012848335.1 PREDICTED: F-box/LRR-repeat protein At3g26922-like [Erythranthe guttata]